MLGTSETLSTLCSLQKKWRTQNGVQFEAEKMPEISAGKLQKFAQLRDSDLRPHFHTKMTRKTRNGNGKRHNHAEKQSGGSDQMCFNGQKQTYQTLKLKRITESP